MSVVNKSQNIYFKMKINFTLGQYNQILKALKQNNFKMISINKYLKHNYKKKICILRHDVDRNTNRALEMSICEKKLNINSTYYFRVYTFDEKVIKKISRMGHEVGYHYEDWNLSNSKKEIAIYNFKKNLNKLKSMTKVKTISMHGSPMKKDSNLLIWKYINCKNYNVEDITTSEKFKNLLYLTDTGRTFDNSNNIRDYVKAKSSNLIKTPDDLINFINNSDQKKLYLSFHPERWTSNFFSWSTQYLKDVCVNILKKIVR